MNKTRHSETYCRSVAKAVYEFLTTTKEGSRQVGWFWRSEMGILEFRERMSEQERKRLGAFQAYTDPSSTNSAKMREAVDLGMFARLLRDEIADLDKLDDEFHFSELRAAYQTQLDTLAALGEGGGRG